MVVCVACPVDQGMCRAKSLGHDLGMYRGMCKVCLRFVGLGWLPQGNRASHDELMDMHTSKVMDGLVRCCYLYLACAGVND